MSSPPFTRAAYRRKCPPKGFGCDNMAGIRLVVEIAKTAERPPKP